MQLREAMIEGQVGDTDLRQVGDNIQISAIPEVDEIDESRYQGPGYIEPEKPAAHAEADQTDNLDKPPGSTKSRQSGQGHQMGSGEPKHQKTPNTKLAEAVPPPQPLPAPTAQPPPPTPSAEAVKRSNEPPDAGGDQQQPQVRESFLQFSSWLETIPFSYLNLISRRILRSPAAQRRPAKAFIVHGR